jgi:hypothetical protein
MTLHEMRNLRGDRPESARPETAAVDPNRGGKKTVIFYLLTTAQNSDAEEPSSAGYPFFGDHMLPVHTSLESLVMAMKACASSSQDDDYIGFQVTDPFELAEMIEDLKEHGLTSLVFDPPPAPDGKLWILGDPIPVDDYCSAIDDIRPLFETLDEEALEEFCRSSHLKKEPFVRWPAAHIGEIAADLRAHIEELTAVNGF